MTDERKKQPRRTDEQRIAYHEARAAKARSEVAKKARALDTRRKILIGSAMMARAEKKGQFVINGGAEGPTALAAYVRPFLSSENQAVIEAWASEPSKPSKPSKPSTGGTGQTNAKPPHTPP